MGKYFSKTEQGKAFWEYIKNEMWRREQKAKAIAEAQTTPHSPDNVNNWITYKT